MGLTRYVSNLSLIVALPKRDYQIYIRTVVFTVPFMFPRWKWKPSIPKFICYFFGGVVSLYL